MIKTIKKSNGTVVSFDPERLNKWASWADKRDYLVRSHYGSHETCL